MFLIIAPVVLLTYVIKFAVARPRPDGSYGSSEHSEALSFPSGHTTQAVAFFGLWFLLAAALLPSHWVLPARVVCIAAIFLTGLSSVRAGDHWPSDVAGGLVWGVAFVFAVLALRPLLPGDSDR